MILLPTRLVNRTNQLARNLTRFGRECRTGLTASTQLAASNTRSIKLTGPHLAVRSRAQKSPESVRSPLNANPIPLQLPQTLPRALYFDSGPNRLFGWYHRSSGAESGP